MNVQNIGPEYRNSKSIQQQQKPQIYQEQLRRSDIHISILEVHALWERLSLLSFVLFLSFSFLRTEKKQADGGRRIHITFQRDPSHCLGGFTWRNYFEISPGMELRVISQRTQWQKTTTTPKHWCLGTSISPTLRGQQQRAPILLPSDLIS